MKTDASTIVSATTVFLLQTRKRLSVGSDGLSHGISPRRHFRINIPYAAISHLICVVKIAVVIGNDRTCPNPGILIITLVTNKTCRVLVQFEIKTCRDLCLSINPFFAPAIPSLFTLRLPGLVPEVLDFVVHRLMLEGNLPIR